MIIYQTRWFAKFARKAKIDFDTLIKAIDLAQKGLCDADLGEGLIKLRVARDNQGKSRGYRFIVAYRQNERAVFIHGFAKKDKDNITPDEVLSLREIGKLWLNADDVAIEQAMQRNALEVLYHDKQKPKIIQPKALKNKQDNS